MYSSIIAAGPRRRSWCRDGV